MKVRILEPAFYNNTYLKKGAIVELNIKKCPSWAEIIEVKEEKKEANKEEKKDETIFGEEEKKARLEVLLNKAIEKDILIDDADKKSVDELINELEELLKEEE